MSSMINVKNTNGMNFKYFKNIYITEIMDIFQKHCLEMNPLNVLLISEYPILHGSNNKVRIGGVLSTTDEKGNDEKIVAVTSDVDAVIMKIFTI